MSADGDIACWKFDEFAPDVGYPVSNFQFRYLVGCAVGADAQLQCWHPYTSLDAEVPQGPVVSFGVGLGAICVVRSDGSASCWHNECGCLGGPNNDECPPHAGGWCDFGVSDLDGSYVEIATGSPERVCARNADGDVFCWKLGLQSEGPPDTGQPFKSIEVGLRHACGILEDNSVVCWGGNNAWNQQDIPPGEYVDLTIGEFNTCAIRTDGRIVCCGRVSDDPNTDLPPFPPP
jgi:hypothetical protein